MSEIAEVHAISVADYIVIYGNKENNKDSMLYPISNLYLQKLMYFLNVIRLLHTRGKKSLIKNDSNNQFETWDYGPVIYNIYEDYSCFNGNPIKHPVKHLLNVSLTNNGSAVGHFINYKNKIENNDIELIRNFINLYIKLFLEYSPLDLVEYSHEEPQWLNRISRGQFYNNKKTYNFYRHRKNQFWREYLYKIRK